MSNNSQIKVMKSLQVEQSLNQEKYFFMLPAKYLVTQMNIEEA